MNLPPRPSDEDENYVIPPDADPYEHMGAAVWALFIIGFWVAAGFVIALARTL